MKYRVKRFSSKILGLSGMSGLTKNKDGTTRKYDTDLTRLGHSLNEFRNGGRELNQELQKARKELRNGI